MGLREIKSGQMRYSSEGWKDRSQSEG